MYNEGPTHVATYALSCLRLLEELAALLRDPNCQLIDQLRFSDVQDALGRFKVWGGNLGAFISSAQSKRSLEHRLREASQIKDQVIKLLTRLSSSLERAIAIVVGHAPNRRIESLRLDDSSSEDDESHSENGSPISDLDGEVRYEVQDLFQAAENTIGNLLRLSVIIHKPIPKDRYARLAALDPIDDRYDQNHVWEKYPHARSLPWLIERIGKANAKRRQYFLYRKKHREKLSQGVTEDARPKVDRVLESKLVKDVPAHNNDADFHSQPSGQRSQETFPSTAATTLILKASSNIDLNATEADSDNGQSMTSFATSVGEGSDQNIRFPPQPEASMNGREFECPYCWTIVTVRNWQAWKKHVIRDLQPYTCTSEACVLRTFPSRAEWFDHEMHTHRKSWYCLYCDREHKTPEQLLQHIQKQHGENITDAQTNTVLRSCERPVQRIAPSTCPFCDDWKVSSSEVAKSNADIVVTPIQFRRHLGRHLEQIALFALPRQHDDGDNDNDEDLDSNRALENSSSDNNSHLSEVIDVGEDDLGQLRLLDVQRRIKLIRDQKMRTFMSTMTSANSDLLNQLQLLWEQALAKRTSRHGPDHPYSLELIEDLATLYQVQKKWDLLNRLRRETLRRVSKPENASVSQVTMDYDKTTAFVLLMKAYRDQGATVSLNSLRMSLMRQALGSESYPTVCNTAYILVDHGFPAEARELCTRAQEMSVDSHYPPQLCVLGQLLVRADMDTEAEQIADRLVTILNERLGISPTDEESIREVYALAKTFFRIGKPLIGKTLNVAATELSERRTDSASRQEEASKLSTGASGKDISQKAPLTQPRHRLEELLVIEPQITVDSELIAKPDEKNIARPEESNGTMEKVQFSEDPLDAALLLAIEQGNSGEVARALDLGANANNTVNGQTVPLYAAASGGHLEIVQILLRCGANVNATPTGQIAPLCAAASGCHVEIVKLLLEKGANPLNDIEDGPLERAVSAGSESIVRTLLDYGVEIVYGHALLTAVELDAQAIVTILLEHSLFENGIPIYHKMQPNLLVASATKGLFEMTKLLIKRGFSPERCPAALFMAASKGYHELCSLFLANGASVEYRNRMCYTALIVAALAGNITIINLLLVHDPVQHSRAEALIAAAAVGKEDAFDILWRICLPEEIEGKGSGVIVAAAKAGHVGIMGTLLGTGSRHLFEPSNPPRVCISGTMAATTSQVGVIGPHESPIFNGVQAGKRYNITDACVAACSLGHVEIVKLLIEDGSRKPSEEELRAAIQNRQCQMILHLFSIGADASPEMLQLALEESDAEVCRVLLKKVTFGNRHNIQLDKCLAVAARKGDILLADEFLQKGKDMGISEQLKVSSAIYVSIENNRSAMALHLIENYQSYSLLDSYIRRSLSVAVRKGLTSIVNGLLHKGVELTFEGVFSLFCYDLLYNAHKNWHPELIETLLRSGEEGPNSQFSRLEFAMQMAITQKHEDLYQFLLARKDKHLSTHRFDRQDPYVWFRVLGIVDNDASYDEKRLMDLLDDRDVSMRIKELNYTRIALLWSALVMAPRSVVLKLISLGADVNLDGQHGKRPLHIAASLGYDEIVEALLEGGADPNLEDADTRTPLEAAIQSRSISTVHCLINFGAIVDFRIMAMVVYKYEVSVIPLSQLVRRWKFSPVFGNIASRLHDSAEVKVELLRCILQMNLAQWINACQGTGKSALDDPTRGSDMNEAVEQQLEGKIYKQWLSTEDESGDNPFRKTLNRLLEEGPLDASTEFSKTPLMQLDTHLHPPFQGYLSQTEVTERIASLNRQLREQITNLENTRAEVSSEDPNLELEHSDHKVEDIIEGNHDNQEYLDSQIHLPRRTNLTFKAKLIQAQIDRFRLRITELEAQLHGPDHSPYAYPDSSHGKEARSANSEGLEKSDGTGQSRLTSQQTRILEATFRQQPKPTTKTRKSLSQQLNLSLDQTNKWFQSRRAEAKRAAAPTGDADFALGQSSSSPAVQGEAEPSSAGSSETQKQAYKILVLQREIRLAKVELSKKQAERKIALAYKRRLEEDLARDQRATHIEYI